MQSLGTDDGTDWMTPAACGALVPFLMVHARTSSGPQVKYRMSYGPTLRPRVLGERVRPTSRLA